MQLEWASPSSLHPTAPSQPGAATVVEGLTQSLLPHLQVTMAHDGTVADYALNELADATSAMARPATARR